MTLSRARLGLAAACLAAVGAPAAIGLVSPGPADAASFAIRLLTALLAVVLLLRARRTAGAPVGAARWCAAALAVGALAAALALLSTTGIMSKAVADAVYLAHVPFAMCGLLALPVSEAGLGARLRAFLDGAIAAFTLAFSVMVLVPAVHSGQTGTSEVVLLATADVALLATALSMLPRVVPHLRRFLVLTSFGLVLIGAANLQKAVELGAQQQVSSHGLRTALLEVGLLLIVAAAARPVGAAVVATGWRWSALAPFVPAGVALVVAFGILLGGGTLTGRELGVGILSFFVLLVRQSIASWDSALLLDRLRQREHAYRDQAMQDQLTGLPNRRAFLQAVDAELAAGHTPTLLLVDCDDFKSINDTQGHATGDAVLRHVGRQMQGAVGSRGTVARLGGDEFGVLLRVDAAQGLLVALQLRAAASARLQIGARSTTTAVSVGGATARTKDDTVSAMLAHADVALYRAKGGEDEGVVVLDEDGRDAAAAHLRLRDDLASPELSEFRVVYQPLFDAQTGEICSVESLLRWDHPVLGCVSPAVFIPLAEQSGVIDVLGDLVLQQALQQLTSWRGDDPDHHLTVSVNVSPRQLADPYFAPKALRLVAAAGLEPSQLVVEITEQAFVRDLAPIAAAARTLREAGVRLAVDDFGTGYSSLRYLEYIPSDILKVDRSYVAASTDSASAAALVRGLLALARELGLSSVAEGVETEEQRALLTELGCNTLQGYLLARPGSPEAVSALLAEARARRVAAAAVPMPRARTAVAG